METGTSPASIPITLIPLGMTRPLFARKVEK